MKTLAGLLLGAAIGVAVGYALFNEEPGTPGETPEVDKDRGEWPDVFCPPQQTAEPMIMASQRLAEMIAKGPPAEAVQVIMDCWMVPPPPEEQEARSQQVFAAWTLSNATPIDWDAVVRELEPTR